MLLQVCQVAARVHAWLHVPQADACQPEDDLMHDTSISRMVTSIWLTENLTWLAMFAHARGSLVRPHCRRLKF